MLVAQLPPDSHAAIRSQTPLPTEGALAPPPLLGVRGCWTGAGLGCGRALVPTAVTRVTGRAVTVAVVALRLSRLPSTHVSR